MNDLPASTPDESSGGPLKNVTVKAPRDVCRRFGAWCKLQGLTIQEVIVGFMREKSAALEQTDPLAAYSDEQLADSLRVRGYVLGEIAKEGRR